MRAIRNLLWFVAAFLLTVWAGVASAQGVVPAYYYVVQSNGSAQGASPEEACMKLHALKGWEYAYTRVDSPTLFYCYAKRPEYNGGNPSRWGDGSRRQCSITAPYFVDGKCSAAPEPQQCMSSDDEYSGEWHVGQVSSGKATGGPLQGGTPTDGQCCIKITDVSSCQHYPKSPKPDNAYCTYKFVRIGGICGEDADTKGPDNPGYSDPQRGDAPPTPSPDPRGDCPKGMVQLGVNSDGVPMCGGTGSDPKNKPPTPPKTQQQDTQQNPDGSSTTTTTTTTTNGDGSTTTVITKTTTGTDGKQTTTESKNTTNAPATGKPGKDDSKQDDEKYDLCKQNPNLTICQNSTVAGKCGEISCMGDAIQCATLRAAAAMQCKQTEEAQALSDSASAKLGQSILNGADPMKSQIDDWMKGSEVDFSSPNIDQSSFLPSSCLSVRSFQAMGQTISVDFSRLCEYIAPLRFVMLAIAFILAYRIVSDSVIKS